MRGIRGLLVLAGAALPALPGWTAGQSDRRPAWDQKKAVETVRKVLDLEKTGQPRDAIPWLTDADRAATRARREQKPIFVFFFLKKPVGPAAAPC